VLLNFLLPPAARGSFEKPPLSVKHPQNFLLKVVSAIICRPSSALLSFYLLIFFYALTAFGLFKVKSFKRRLKASIPNVQANSYAIHDFRRFAAFPAGSIHLKKPSGGPKGLIGPPCHGGLELNSKIWHN
jgi:hypothetical protein